MWLGHTAYLEIADGAVPDYQGGHDPRLTDGRGYIAVDEIRMSDRPGPPCRRRGAAPSRWTWTPSPRSLRAGRPDACRPAPRSASTVIARSRRRSPSRRSPWRSPTARGMDEHVHIRGSHRNLGELVPRRFLEVLGGTSRPRPPRAAAGSSWPGGWSTPGQPPDAPRAGQPALEAPFRRGDRQVHRRLRRDGTRADAIPSCSTAWPREFVAGGWSIKAMHRLIVTSSTYRMSSVPDRRGRAARPRQRALHRMNVRRLEAEAIRDALLRLSGRLDPRHVRPERRRST